MNNSLQTFIIKVDFRMICGCLNPYRRTMTNTHPNNFTKIFVIVVDMVDPIKGLLRPDEYDNAELPCAEILVREDHQDFSSAFHWNSTCRMNVY